MSEPVTIDSTLEIEFQCSECYEVTSLYLKVLKTEDRLLTCKGCKKQAIFNVKIRLSCVTIY